MTCSPRGEVKRVVLGEGWILGSDSGVFLLRAPTRWSACVELDDKNIRLGLTNQHIRLVAEILPTRKVDRKKTRE